MLKKLEPHQALLLQAAVEMQARGFCQHRLEDAEGRVCLEGALRAAYAGDGLPWEDPVYLRAQQVLRDHVGCGSHQLWNDTRGRTAEDAIAALEAAAVA